MVWIPILLAGLAVCGDDGAEPPASDRAPTLHLFDLNDDGLLDRLELGVDGSVAVALNRGARQFEPVVQTLPTVLVADVLFADLNGDGGIDMYLVSSGPNVALIGDDTGRFTESTDSLGLTDAGAGVDAERVDIDADGIADVLLHNATGDVIFWGTGTAFERDPSTPAVEVAAEGGAPLLPGAVVVTPPAGGARAPAAGSTGGAGDGKLAKASAPSNRVAVTVAKPPKAGPATLVDPPADVLDAIELPTCATTIRDASTGDCIWADSTPTLGRLYPLSIALNVDGSGNVGMGTTSPQEALHVVGETPMTTVLIAPDTDTNGAAQIMLAEDDDASFASFRLRYDGVANDRFLIESEVNDTATERFSIGRNNGYVGIGTSGLPTSRLHVVGDTFVEGRIRSDQTSNLWFSGMDLVLHNQSLTTGAIRHFAPGSDNYGEIYRTSSAGFVTTMMPLSAIPEHVYGQPVTVTDVTIYFKTDAGEYINYTYVYDTTGTILLDNTDRSSSSSSSYTLSLSDPIDGDMAILFETYHDATGTASCVSIPRVQLHLTY